MIPKYNLPENLYPTFYIIRQIYATIICSVGQSIDWPTEISIAKVAEFKNKIVPMLQFNVDFDLA